MVEEKFNFIGVEEKFVCRLRSSVGKNLLSLLSSVSNISILEEGEWEYMQRKEMEVILSFSILSKF